MSITMYTISSIFRLLTVTHGQGLLSIKFNALYMCKQHPSMDVLKRPFRYKDIMFSELITFSNESSK